jgi:hypothetical protein
MPDNRRDIILPRRNGRMTLRKNEIGEPDQHDPEKLLEGAIFLFTKNRNHA